MPYERWHTPEYSDYLSERYWPAFSQLDDAGQRAFWDVLSVQEEHGKEAPITSHEPTRRAMAHITDITLYPESNYLHYNDTDLKRGFVHGYHVNQEHTIALLRLYGADEISVIVHDNNRDIPRLGEGSSLM